MARRGAGRLFARLVALALAVSASGAGRVAAMTSPLQPHRCACAAHASRHHDCACALCQRMALEARAADPAAPPCHRAAARSTLSRAQREDGREDVPCLRGRCGSEDHAPVTVGGVEPYVPIWPEASGDSPPRPAAPAARLSLASRPAEPESPPPR